MAVWVEIVLAVLKLVLEIPAVQEWLKRIFGALSHASRVQAGLEMAGVLKALREKTDHVAKGLVGTVPCPLEALALKLEAKYQP